MAMSIEMRIGIHSVSTGACTLRATLQRILQALCRAFQGGVVETALEKGPEHPYSQSAKFTLRQTCEKLYRGLKQLKPETFSSARCRSHFLALGTREIRVSTRRRMVTTLLEHYSTPLLHTCIGCTSRIRWCPCDSA